MRVILIITICWSFLSTGQEVNTTSKINEVTLYLQGARIERSATVQLEKGTQEIRLNNLSPDIDEATINITDLDGLRLNGFTYGSTGLEKKDSSAKMEGIIKEIEIVEKEIAGWQAINNGLDQEQLLLENNRNLNSKDTGLSLAQIKEFGAYYRTRFTEIIESRNANNDLITTAADKLNELKTEKEKLNPDANESRGLLTLKVVVPSTRRYKINFNYNVYSAGWVPIYDITAKGTDEDINLTFKAQAYQATGSDWKDVKLNISTGDPNLDNQMPQLTAKRLGFVRTNYSSRATSRSNKRYNPMVKTVRGKILDSTGEPLLGATVLVEGTSNGTTTDFDGNYVITVNGGKNLVVSYVGYENYKTPIYASTMNIDLKDAMNSLDEVVIVGYASQSKRSRFDYDAEEVLSDDEYIPPVVDNVEENIASRTFKLTQLYSIESTGESTDIEISNDKIKANYSYYTAPAINENVFLTATLTDWENLNLIPGEANVYFEDAYIGKIYFDTDTIKEELVVGLGVDPQISVKREDIKDFKSKSFLGSNRIVYKNYEITLKNNRNKAVTIKLQDRVPMSGNSDIKVDDIEIGDAQMEEDTQILTWEMNLTSGNQVKERFSYRVKYPKRRRINLE